MKPKSKPKPKRSAPPSFAIERRRRKPGDYGPGYYKVDNALSPEDREAYHALLRAPGATGRAAQEWLAARGYQLGAGAVERHRRRFKQRLDAVRASAEMSLACADLVRLVGVNRMTDASVVRFETLLSEALMGLKAGAELDREQWDTLGRALAHAVASRTKVDALRLAGDEPRPPADGPPNPGRPRRLDGAALSDKVRRILGVPLPGEAVLGLPVPESSFAPKHEQAPAQEEQQTERAQE